MPDDHPLKSPQFKCFAIMAWVLAAAAVTTLLTLGLFWRMSSAVTGEARRMGEAIAADFQRALNFTPEVRVDSVVVVAASAPAFELVTMKKQMLVQHRWTHTWLHSTKNLDIEATFTAAAGFNLGESFSIHIDPNTKWISADLPPPKILSLSMGDIRITRDEDGLWNKTTPAEREQAFRDLEKEARKQFAQSNLLAEARMAGETRIRELLDKSNTLKFVPKPKPTN